jgi:integrase
MSETGTKRKTATAAMIAGKEKLEVPEKDAKNVERFLLEKQADGKAANTLRAYRAALAKLGSLTDVPLADLTRDQFTKLVVKLNGRKSVRWYVLVLKTFLNWNERTDVRGWAKGAATGNPNKWKDPEALLSRDEVSKMIAGETDPRDKAFLCILWDTGRRVHEVLALDLADVSNRDGMSVRFRKAKVASEAGTRVRLIESADAVRKWLAVHPLLRKGDRTDGVPLFVTMYDGELRRMSYSAALDTVRHAAAKVGIRKHVHPHLFRHSRATELRLIGVSDDSIRLRLGWVRGSNMIARYVSLADDQADDEVAAKLGLKVEKRPASVRKLELGAEIPALGDEVDALKARIAEMERDREKLAIEAVRGEVEKMAASFRAMLKDGGFEVKDRELTAEESSDKKAVGVWVSTKKT